MQYKIDGITVRQYNNLIDTSEADEWIKYSKLFKEPVNNFGLKELEKLTFIEVKDFQQSLADGMSILDTITLLDKLKLKYLDTELFKVSQQFYWIVEQIEAINDKESKTLSGSGSTSDQIDAGIEVFEKYGIYTQVISLAEYHKVLPEVIEQREYNRCFIELLYLKDKHDYQKRYNDIINAKQK